MTVAEYRMKVGAGSFDVSPYTPSWILNLVHTQSAGFTHVVILPTHLDCRVVPDDGMLGAARYTGRLIHDEGGGNRVQFEHASAVLGDDVMETQQTTADGFLSQWFTQLALPGGLIQGTVHPPIGGPYTLPFQYVTRKEAWETLTQHFGVEWRVNPWLDIDVGPWPALYGADPRVIILNDAGTGGRDLTLTGVQGVASLDTDVEDWASRVILLTKDPSPPEGVDDPPPIVTVATGATPFRQAFGAPLVRDKLIDNSSRVDPDPASTAAAELAKVNTPRFQLTVSSDGYHVEHLTPVGAPIFVFDPTGGAVDELNPVIFRGQVTFPIQTRVVGMTWPIRRGMGVYLRRQDGDTVTWTDLTPYVRWESGPTRLDVGVLPRTLNG